MRNLIERFIKEEDGMEMVEWALVAGLVVIAAVAAWGNIGKNVSAVMSELDKKTADAKNAMN
jgi:Flp pilus assembly pilin Flp